MRVENILSALADNITLTRNNNQVHPEESNHL